jgi:hypothetical protein
VANVMNRRQNTVERVPLAFGHKTVTAVGEPFTEQLVGPTNGVWRHQHGEKCIVAYFITEWEQKHHRVKVRLGPHHCCRWNSEVNSAPLSDALELFLCGILL